MQVPAQMEEIVSNGLSFPDDPEIMTDRLRTLLRRGRYEASEARTLKTFVGENSSIVELGAGIGYISTSASVHFGARSVTCIEANPKLCDYIREVHRLNDVAGSQVINAIALPGLQAAQSAKSLPFYVAKPFWSSAMERPEKLKSKKIEVPVVSLDQILANTKADALICDIEGGEAKLFDDLDLGSVRYVLVELHTNRIKAEGVVNLFENMHRHGFFYHQQASGEGVVLFKKFRAARPKK
ncbi:MAG: FkbM family methyltransferase [Roseobacter sp.]